MASNELQVTLDSILQDKNTNLKPENLKQGVSCLGIEGTLRHWVPDEVKLVDLKQWLTGYPYLIDRDTVFFIVEDTANKCHVLRKSDQAHFELTN